HGRNPRPVRTTGYRRRRTALLQSRQPQRVCEPPWRRRFYSACLSGGRLCALQASIRVALLFLLSESETFSVSTNTPDATPPQRDRLMTGTARNLSQSNRKRLRFDLAEAKRMSLEIRSARSLSGNLCGL